MAKKIAGMNWGSYERTRDILKEEMWGGIVKTRSLALSFVISDFMAYCYQEGLSFEHVMTLAKKQFKWQISRECLKCKGKMSPDDVSDGDGYCASCIPEDIQNRK